MANLELCVTSALYAVVLLATEQQKVMSSPRPHKKLRAEVPRPSTPDHRIVDVEPTTCPAIHSTRRQQPSCSTSRDRDSATNCQPTELFFDDDEVVYNSTKPKPAPAQMTEDGQPAVDIQIWDAQAKVWEAKASDFFQRLDSRPLATEPTSVEEK